MNSPQTSEMLHLISGFHVSRALYVAAKLGLADLVQGGCSSCAQLAQATQTDPRSLHRLLRVLASAGVFGLDGDQVHMTSLSPTLLSDSPGSLRGWAIDQLGGEHYQAWGELLHSVRTGEVAFDKVFGQNAWAHRAENPQSAQEFDAGMASFIDAHHHAVLNSYPFAQLETLYDIGGGDGQFMCTVLLACPQLRGLVLDQPHVIARTEQRLQEAGLGNRCQAVGGDIFESIPAGGAAYMLSRVLHDWNDAQVGQILAVCRRAMSANSVLLLAERVLPEQVIEGPQARALTVSDLNMLVMTGGCERTPSQYKSLLEAAGFALQAIRATHTAMSVIEARPC
jgi:hypothetical protein